MRNEGKKSCLLWGKCLFDFKIIETLLTRKYTNTHTYIHIYTLVFEKRERDRDEAKDWPIHGLSHARGRRVRQSEVCDDVEIKRSVRD
jgi:hypothetical protein